MREQLDYPASYYAASANVAPLRPALAGTEQCDVCIVGAGYTGLSAAIALAEAGFKVIVLEAARVGFGASGRNGGQIINSYSRDLDVIERRHGRDQAAAMGALAFEGGRIIRERVAKYGIACDLKSGNLFAALTAKQLDELAEKKALWERYGHTGLRLIGTAELPSYIGSKRYVGALLDEWGGHIHPLNLTLGEAAAFESLGGQIFEQSAVTRIDPGTPAAVHTAKGLVRAEFVIVAGNAYLGDLVPALAEKSLPCGTQIIATEPLTETAAAELLPQDHCVEDCNYMLDYYRLSADRRLLYGGGTVYGARDSAAIEAQIRANLKKTFPQLADVRVDYAWTGNFLLTLSRLPQAGRIGSNIYYSQGCSGHGVTYSHLAGVMLAEAIRGQGQRFDVFAGLPHYAFPGGRLLRVPMLTLGAWYYGLRDRLGV
ncbi:NAD(P)/FAD-dependent oxidoreductase [Paludibacterium purpuratum]|uniref:Gamma-glutamylputrescine oxidase n=1 Tax=Paludibacterium purpuratum TaxID=1144873 RepID=A0A4R7B3C3_9NEIS|nr:FAD-binding oxidoreductase [Paludibacterium purpuratum]TDR76674.1 gamma-glutamylputrescine oxidase [Paludibacterium purpuratum]